MENWINRSSKISRKIFETLINEIEMSVGMGVATAYTRLASIGRQCGANCEPVDGEEGDADNTDGGVEGDSDDGTETSPIAFAQCRYVTLEDGERGAVDDAVIAAVTADENGHFFFPLDPVPQGFVECNPPEFPALVTTHFVRKGVISERITQQKVDPASTVINNTLRRIRDVEPELDLGDVEIFLSKSNMDKDSNISFLSELSIILFNVLIENEINVDFLLALDDLSSDGRLDLEGTEDISDQIEGEGEGGAEDDGDGAPIEVASTLGSIRGRVVEVGGKALAGAQVLASQRNVEVRTRELTITNLDGAFLLDNIPEGETSISILMSDEEVGNLVVTVIALFTVDAEIVIDATSAELTVMKSGDGRGLVASAPSGIDCGIDCLGTYAVGETVTLIASAETNSEFVAWNESDCSGSGPCTVVMEQDRIVTATFALITLAIQGGGGNGSGTITSDIGGIECFTSGTSQRETCTGHYNFGDQVRLTAVSDGSTFTAWGGDGCSGSTPECVVTMDRSRTLTAQFVRPVLSIAGGGGNGSGTITSDIDGIACNISGTSEGGTCTWNYNLGDQVRLTAAGNGSTFTAWGGNGCSGSIPECVVTMDRSRTITAQFD